MLPAPGSAIWRVFLLGIALLGCAGPTRDAEDRRVSLRTGWLRTERPMRTWKDLRDRHVVLQGFDYSCGAGALATLLRYYFEDPVSEQEILLGILQPMTSEEVLDREKNGLSLLDLKQYAERRGYRAVGVRLNYTDLKQLRGPVLIHLEREEYRHFAVLKGMRGDRIELADPSRGNVRMSVLRFAREWSGIALVLGRKGFGLPVVHPLSLSDPEPGRMETEAARRSLRR